MSPQCRPHTSQASAARPHTDGHCRGPGADLGLPGGAFHTHAVCASLFHETVLTFLLNILSGVLCPWDIDFHSYINGVLHIYSLLFLHKGDLDSSGSTCVRVIVDSTLERGLLTRSHITASGGVRELQSCLGEGVHIRLGW